MSGERGLNVRETLTTVGEIVAYCIVTAGLTVGLGVLAGSLISGGVLLGLVCFWIGDE